jgi:hypothetical protein
VRAADGVEITVDLENATVTVRIASEERVSKTGEKTGWGDRDRQGDEDRVRTQLKDELEAKVDAEQRRLREEVTSTLEKKVRDLRKELDQAVNKTTAAALKERAAQIGEIEQVSEEENGGITIKVRL